MNSDAACSLQEAIFAANFDASLAIDPANPFSSTLIATGCEPGSGADVIELVPGAVYTLSDAVVDPFEIPGHAGTPLVLSTLTVEGHGAVIVRGGAADLRAFVVGGASETFTQATVSGTGDLTLHDLRIEGFRARGGDGGSSAGGGLGAGGAVFVNGGAGLVEPGDGAFVFATQPKLTLERCTLDGNTAQGGNGGASATGDDGAGKGGGGLGGNGGQSAIVTTPSGGGGAGADSGGLSGGGTATSGSGTSGGRYCGGDFGVAGCAGGGGGGAQSGNQGPAGGFGGGGGGGAAVHAGGTGGFGGGGGAGGFGSVGGTGGAGGFGGGGGGGGGTFNSDGTIGIGGPGGFGGGNGEDGSAGPFPGAGGGGAGLGGAIFSTDAVVVLRDCTLDANGVIGGTGGGGAAGDGAALGGAIFTRNGSLNVVGTTVNGSTGLEDVRVLADAAPAALALFDTIVAGNPNGAAEACRTSAINAGSVNASGAGNLIVHNAIATGCPGVAVTIDPALGPLALNAPGTTPTRAIGLTSPARDAGDGASCLATDQRGVARPALGGCDVGAFEVEAPTQTAIACAPNPASQGQIVVCMVTVTSAAGTPGGTVDVSVGATVVVAAAPLDPGGVAQVTLPPQALVLGTNAVGASYPGAGGYLPSVAPAASVVLGALVQVPALDGAGLGLLAVLLGAFALWRLRRRVS